jgi:hypothetical protein
MCTSQLVLLFFCYCIAYCSYYLHHISSIFEGQCRLYFDWTEKLQLGGCYCLRSTCALDDATIFVVAFVQKISAMFD